MEIENDIMDCLVWWYKGEAPGPVVIDINPTNRCNLRCLSCWLRAYPNIDYSIEVPMTRYLSLVDEAAELGVKHWMVTGGGEPMFFKKRSMELLRRIKQLNMQGSITTNATLFDQQDAKTLVSIGWDKVVVSIDGDNPDTVDYLRGMKGSFKRIVEFLENIQRFKGALGSPKPLMQFNIVLSRVNMPRMTNIIEFAHKMGVQIVSFEPLTVHSAMGEKLKITDNLHQQLDELACLADERAKELNVYTNARAFIDHPLIEQSNNMISILKKEGDPRAGFLGLPCYEPFYHLVIKPDGSVGPCCIFDDAAAPNIRQMPLAEAWYGSFFENIRNMLLEHRFPSYCNICNSGQVLMNRGLREKLKKIFYKQW